MGYSCCAAADNALNYVMDMAIDPSGSSNSWRYNGADYFYEIGRENADGAVTGTVNKMVGDGKCLKAGGFRIEPDGKITRFTGLPRNARVNALAAYEAGCMENYHMHREPRKSSDV